MDLANLQELFQNLIFNNDLKVEEFITPPLLGTTKARLDIYTNGYIARLEEVLANDFSTLLMLLGENKFYDLTYQYIINYPSTHFSIDRYGEKFPEFLLDIKKHYAEIAAFEWAESCVLTAKNAPVLSLVEMQKITLSDWPLITFKLHPSLQLIEHQWNSLDIIEALRMNSTPPKAKLLKVPMSSIVWRKNLEVQYCAIQILEKKLITAIQNKLNFSEICELLCKDLSESKVSGYVVNQILIYLERGLLVNH